MVLTDIIKRWSVLRGNKAIMCTGTDEHGLKVSIRRGLVLNVLTVRRSNEQLPRLALTPRHFAIKEQISSEYAIRSYAHNPT